MNNRESLEEAYITFCKSHDGNWSARDLFYGGMKAALASQAQQTELSSNPLQLAAQNPTAWLVRERSKRTGLLSNEILVENKNHFRDSENFKYEFVPLYTIPPAPEGGDK